MRNADGARIIMEQDVIENHRQYLERVTLYKSFGYDVEKERQTIIEQALPVAGTIAEIGTGKGYFALVLARAGYRFITVDCS